MASEVWEMDTQGAAGGFEQPAPAGSRANPRDCVILALPVSHFSFFFFHLSAALLDPWRTWRQRPCLWVRRNLSGRHAGRSLLSSSRGC